MSKPAKALHLFENNYLDTLAITKLFKDQLGTMYSALSHLSVNLSALALLASFEGLRLAVQECLEDTTNN